MTHRALHFVSLPESQVYRPNLALHAGRMALISCLLGVVSLFYAAYASAESVTNMELELQVYDQYVQLIDTELSEIDGMGAEALKVESVAVILWDERGGSGGSGGSGGGTSKVSSFNLNNGTHNLQSTNLRITGP